MGKPHLLAIPYPAQGHVIPLLEFMQYLVKYDFKVTFVNTEFNHTRVMKALPDKERVGDHIHLVSIPDGLEPWEDRNDLGKLTEAFLRIMPGKLKELIEKINKSDNDKITCIIADVGMGWALEVAEKMQIRRAAFCTAAAGMHALVFSIPKLIDDGIIQHDGKNSHINSQTFSFIITHNVGSCIPCTLNMLFDPIYKESCTMLCLKWFLGLAAEVLRMHRRTRKARLGRGDS